MTYVLVGGLLILVSCLILFRLVIIRLAVFCAQSLPLVTQDLADLTCLVTNVRSLSMGAVTVRSTEADARIFFANGFSLVIGEEHVGRQATLWRIWIYRHAVSKEARVR
jgi:hypothetical protein